MKKILPMLLLPFFLTCISLDAVKKPEARIKKFDIDSISLRDITFVFDIGIENPYPIGFKLDDISMNFKVEGGQLFKTTAKGFSVKAMGESVTSFKVNLKYADIMKIVSAYANRDYLECTVDLAMKIPLPEVGGMKKSIPLSYTLKKSIPAIKPEISVSNFRVKTPQVSDISGALKNAGRSAIDPGRISGMLGDLFSGKRPRLELDPSSLDLRIAVDFDIELKNNTKARLLFNDLNYDFLVNGEKLVGGSTSDIKTSGNKSVISVSNFFSTRALGKSIISAFNSKKGNYSLTGYSMIKLPDAVRTDPVRLTFNEKGSFGIK